MVRLKIVLFMLCLYKCHSQDQNSISYDKLYSSNNEVVLINQDKFNLNLPIKNSFTIFANYTAAHLDLLIDQSFIESDIKNLYSFDLGIKLDYTLKNNWKSTITFNPQATNNTLKNIDLDNFVFNSALHFQKKLKNNSEITFGVEYGTLFGKNTIYPFFDYKKKFTEKISITVGFPKSSFDYIVNEKNNLQFSSSYNNSFYTISEANSRYINTTMVEYKSISWSSMDLSLKYKYIFFNQSVFNLTLGKSFLNEFKIKESNNGSTNFNVNNDFNISMGFKYNLNFK